MNNTNPNNFLSDALNKSNNSLNSSMNNFNSNNNTMKITKANQENQIVESMTINLVSEKEKNFISNNSFREQNNNMNLSNNNLSMMSNAGNLQSLNTNENFSKINNKQSNFNNRQGSPTDFSNNQNKNNRSLQEIVAKINEYMSKTSKNTIVEVYKMFDKDANSLVDKNVFNFLICRNLRKDFQS